MYVLIGYRWADLELCGGVGENGIVGKQSTRNQIFIYFPRIAGRESLERCSTRS